MSTASHRSSSSSSHNAPQRRLQSSRSVGGAKARAPSRAQPVISREDGYTYALRVAYLHYLLQPRPRRKQYVPAPKPAQRASTHTGSIGHLVAELAGAGSGSGSSSHLKLPNDFRKPLEKRMEGVLRGVERLPGFGDPAVKRSFAEAYTAFTERSFQKSIDRERKLEPMVLIFYSSAVKVAQKGAADDSWKQLPDRHAALFVRLLTSILTDMGQDRERAELMSRLSGLEKRLLTNEDLGQNAAGMTAVEVTVPHSYQVKDMPMVQLVGRMFGVPSSQIQDDLDAARTIWTEEAAVRDLKTYQHRLASNMTGALRTQDFDLEETWQEWKKAETGYLTHMIVDIFTAKPELKRAPRSSSGLDLPTGTARPQSLYYGEDQAYADLGRAVLSDNYSDLPSEQGLSFSALSLEQPSTIRSVDEPNYTFTPHDPRSFYKAILQQAMALDRAHADPGAPPEPLSPQSLELLTEIVVRWRLPQSSRLVAFAEVISRQFCEREVDGVELDTALEFIKSPPAEPKKAPYIQNYSASLLTLPPSYWTSDDTLIYQQHVLSSLNSGLLRDLHGLMMKCYDGNPTIGVVMHNLQTHVRNEPQFVQSDEEDQRFAAELAAGLKHHAEQVYRTYIDKFLPASPEQWNFLHVVELGKAAVKLCEKIKKRYSKNPVIMGVNPLTVLVETMFPNFEEDTNAIVQRIQQEARESGAEVHVQDGFDLYRELVSIRRIHAAALPSQPFAFSIEDLLSSYVWRFISDAEASLDGRIDEAIKLDPFQVRNSNSTSSENGINGIGAGVGAGGQDDGRANVPAGDSDRHSSSVMDIFTLFNATVSQLEQLRWENDVHRAKFMTALSKSFTAGVGRYCEVVEGKFLKEMDRPSAQEVAATQQKQKTAQERFLQYAQAAWNTKEKPEPFQFYAESFVKLNNIEYAMQEMERLESTMNVDMFAALLAKVEPPKARRPTKFVFTVKIVEAEDLRACDPNGTSDPYVILGDEFKKRLYKSRIVYKTLNPRWDESVDIASKGAVNLIVTIWDWDTFGEHDCVGRTALKLDPVHFSDFLPREFWLDLDTQGRVLLRVSMEGEQDGIEFYFGKAFRYLKRTERDMVRKITEKLSAQINDTLSRDTLRSLLKTGGIGASVTSLWKKSTASASSSATAGTTPTGPGEAEIEQALLPLCSYFNENFAIMNQTLTRATMDAVMARLWKEVLMAIESLVVPPLSDKPSTQRPLTQKELDIVFSWLNQLFEFFNAKDQSGEQLGVKMDVLKSPKYLELFSLNFFYFDDTPTLILESERIASAAAQRAQQAVMPGGHLSPANHRISAPPSTLSPPGMGGTPFASMGTIRRGKSLMLSRNLGTMRRVKEEKRREAQAEPSDDMILRILRMRPEAAAYIKERFRQKERQAATAAAARIVMNSVSQGWNSTAASVGMGGGMKRNSLMPRR